MDGGAKRVTSRMEKYVSLYQSLKTPHTMNLRRTVGDVASIFTSKAGPARNFHQMLWLRKPDLKDGPVLTGQNMKEISVLS
jgi:hypothetical protein